MLECHIWYKVRSLLGDLIIESLCNIVIDWEIGNMNHIHIAQSERTYVPTTILLRSIGNCIHNDYYANAPQVKLGSLYH